MPIMSSIFAQQLSAMSHPARIASSARSGTVPDSASMSRSSVSSSPSKPILPRITSPITAGDWVAGWSASHAVNRRCPVIPMGASFSARNGARSVSSSSSLAVTVGSSLWLSHVGAAVAGHVLDAARHPGARQPVERRAAQRGDAHRLAAERAVADHVVRAGLAHIEQRQVIDGDPRLGEIEPQRLRHWPARPRSR